MKNTVRQLRESRGLSQRRLGELLGVSRQTINSIETGRYALLMFCQFAVVTIALVVINHRS